MQLSRRQPRGFTLVELVLVMVILTIIVGAMAPSFRGFTTGRTGKNTASRLLSLASFARTSAISEGRTYKLTYNAQARTVSLSYEDGGQVYTPASDLGASLDIPEGITLETDMPQTADGRQAVAFQPSGRTEPATITLTDAFSTRIRIACSSATELFRILPDEEAN